MQQAAEPPPAVSPDDGEPRGALPGQPADLVAGRAALEGDRLALHARSDCALSHSGEGLRHVLDLDLVQVGGDLDVPVVRAVRGQHRLGHRDDDQRRAKRARQVDRLTRRRVRRRRAVGREQDGLHDEPPSEDDVRGVSGEVDRAESVRALQQRG